MYTCILSLSFLWTLNHRCKSLSSQDRVGYRYQSNIEMGSQTEKECPAWPRTTHTVCCVIGQRLRFVLKMLCLRKYISSPHTAPLPLSHAYTLASTPPPERRSQTLTVSLRSVKSPFNWTSLHTHTLCSYSWDAGLWFQSGCWRPAQLLGLSFLFSCSGWWESDCAFIWGGLENDLLPRIH